jgi:hypothetical protein
MDRLLKGHRVHDLVTRGHDQRRATTLVYAAKPPGIKIPLVQVLFTRLGVLADLHRHATPRARITIAGNNNSAISISLFVAQVLTPILHGKISEWTRQIFCPRFAAPHSPWSRQSREALSHAQARIREAVIRNRQDKLTALLHHLSVEVLRASFFDLKKFAAPGVDEMTWTEYRGGLEEKALEPPNLIGR